MKFYGIIKRRVSTFEFGENLFTLYDQWNTFQYVTKNISGWADDTTIGKEVRESLKLLTDCFYSMVANTEKLTQVLKEFINEQKTINNG